MIELSRGQWQLLISLVTAFLAASLFRGIQFDLKFGVLVFGAMLIMLDLPRRIKVMGSKGINGLFVPSEGASILLPNWLWGFGLYVFSIFM